MPPATGNLYAPLDAAPGGEAFETLFEGAGARVDRIVSHDHASPAGFWYDQPAAEWVVVLRGEATLEFADGSRVELATGDWITIPPRTPHRIARTGAATTWLAMHAGGER